MTREVTDSLRVRARLAYSELAQVAEAIGVGCRNCGVEASNLKRALELLHEIGQSEVGDDRR